MRSTASRAWTTESFHQLIMPRTRSNKISLSLLTGNITFILLNSDENYNNKHDLLIRRCPTPYHYHNHHDPLFFFLITSHDYILSYLRFNFLYGLNRIIMAFIIITIIMICDDDLMKWVSLSCLFLLFRSDFSTINVILPVN